MSPDVKFLLLCVVVLGVVGWAGVVEDREWARYALVHDCRVVSTSVKAVWQPGQVDQPSSCYNATVTCYACAPGPLGVSVCR